MAQQTQGLLFELPGKSQARNQAIRQWHWEESVNTLRNQARESTLRTHWTPTGITTIDATARAHIAEWDVLDNGSEKLATLAPSNHPSVIDALVHRGLAATNWDLYAVESVDDSIMTVRCLRYQRGYRVCWVEGRTPPPINSTVALRLIHLDPPGLYASTLPLIFRSQPVSKSCPGSASLIMALLRAFGASDHDTWSNFMRELGARILLEHVLSHLQIRAASYDPCDLQQGLRYLDDSFSELEAALFNDGDKIPRHITLDDGRHAWIEDVAGGPHLLLFESRADWNQYRIAALRTSKPANSGTGVSWCRAYRIPPDELHPVEWKLARQAGLCPEQNGVIRLQRRSREGHFQDPTDDDRLAIQQACTLFSQRWTSQVA